MKPRYALLGKGLAYGRVHAIAKQCAKIQLLPILVTVSPT